MNKILILLLLIALAALAAQVWLFGSYDDCVLDNMKAELSADGVAAIKTACRNKYPFTEVEKQQQDLLQPVCHTINLTDEETGNIQLQPKGSDYSIWNGNNFTVNDLTFNIQFKSFMEFDSKRRKVIMQNDEVNKSVGSMGAVTSQPALEFPSDIYSYSVIKATKQSCK